MRKFREILNSYQGRSFRLGHTDFGFVLMFGITPEQEYWKFIEIGEDFVTIGSDHFGQYEHIPINRISIEEKKK